MNTVSTFLATLATKIESGPDINRAETAGRCCDYSMIAKSMEDGISLGRHIPVQQNSASPQSTTELSLVLETIANELTLRRNTESREILSTSKANSRRTKPTRFRPNDSGPRS